jgi:hypothetical protein
LVFSWRALIIDLPRAPRFAQFQERWKPVLRPELRKNKDLEGNTVSKKR